MPLRLFPPVASNCFRQIQARNPRQPNGCTQSAKLDGAEWLISIDPDNVGREERWFTATRPNARTTPVLWVNQGFSPGYHGFVWCWREFQCAINPDSDGRYLLRFWNVDYLGQVWVNDQYGMFALDVTDAVAPGWVDNRLAVRALNLTG